MCNDKYEWKNVNLDFTNLYPHIMTSFDITNNEVFMNIFRERQRIKKIKERKEKLNRLNNL
jgi:hypothetical protein